MSSAVELLEKAIQAGAVASGDEYRWESLLAAMREVITAPLSAEAERLLLALLRFDGRLRLDAASEFPHSLSPEDMLKSLSVQALAKWTGPTYTREIQKLQATARSPGLISGIKAVLQRLRPLKRKRVDLEQVAEISQEGPSTDRIIRRPLREEAGLTFWADRPGRHREPHLASQAS